MADEDFKKYLATEILSEQRTVSYRNVARALKVHVNVAKCMLYDFLEFQNGKKPGSVYATYLLSGVKKPQSTVGDTNGTNGHRHGEYKEDDPIPSSPPPFTSSMLEPSQRSSPAAEDERPHVPVCTITLVREEDLEAMKEQYEIITSIHVYSLSPGRIQDLVTLTDISRGLFVETFTKEDPLLNNKTYGIIQNPNVRRRKGKKPIVPQDPPPKFQPVKEDFKSLKSSSTQNNRPAPKPATPASTNAKHEEPSRPSSRDSTSTATSARQAPLKRDSSDLFKAFAKQSQQKPKTKPTLLQDQDTPMHDDEDEGESEDEALFLETETRKGATTKKRTSDVRKEREDKAAKLRKMMESDDEAEPEVPNVEKATGVKDEPVTAQKGTDAAEDAEEIAWSDSDTEKPRQSAPKQDASADGEHIATSAPAPAPRRRRGKRKVMKKRTMKDEDGYLVTKEEAVWESFSEDEPEPTPARAPLAKKETTRNSLGGGKGQAHTQSQGQKGAGGKPGAKKGGTIMSFFGKKS
ncbi:hypothetical protein A1O1_09275 [Capronia coronata CBS 617.96]|uniref:DNA polymerase delta subunit 3 n=1 Tax=Capronia coronata CBS 617.96 TaxID=1182541 RepID=W9XFA5_9EURO|nr:uncharacterized protein A1O1_09275 [Capronia coronata CBS 617.96]EXJ78873.1 hypothetical protein A1O1_09275 [Capronia coronata CBS 617.96]